LEARLIGAAHSGDMQVADAAFAGFFNALLQVSDVFVVLNFCIQSWIVTCTALFGLLVRRACRSQRIP
ncbi:MAG: hypothetical protein ACJZ68_05345, partial [Limisphaerales bacterium]